MCSHHMLDFGCLKIYQNSGLRQGNSLFRPDLHTFILVTYSILDSPRQSVVLTFLVSTEVASWPAKSVCLKLSPLWRYGVLLMQVLLDHSWFVGAGWVHTVCLFANSGGQQYALHYLPPYRHKVSSIKESACMWADGACPLWDVIIPMQMTTGHTEVLVKG